jgi:hypothetical protein
MLLGVGTLYAAGAMPAGLLTPSPPPSRSPTQFVVGVGSGVKAKTRAPVPALAPAPTPTSAPASASSSAASSKSQGSAAPRGLDAEPAAKESWQRVAQGLRESDLVSSDEELLKLSHQGSAADRETAKLVRAQVLLRQGRVDEAQALLVELRDSGTLVSTRSKATLLLRQLAPARSSHRSFEPSAGTNQP